MKLYDAIGQRDARFRKRTAVARAIERLVILDHVIGHRDLTWLGPEQDKLAHFLTTTSLRREELLRLAFGKAADVVVRYFPDKLPIGVSADQRFHALLYLLLNPVPKDFRTFLRRHAELLRALPSWSIRLMVPTGMDGDVVDAYQRAFREELATPRTRKRHRAAVVLSRGGRDRFRRASVSKKSTPRVLRAAISCITQGLAAGRRQGR